MIFLYFWCIIITVYKHKCSCYHPDKCVRICKLRFCNDAMVIRQHSLHSIAMEGNRESRWEDVTGRERGVVHRAVTHSDPVWSWLVKGAVLQFRTVDPHITVRAARWRSAQQTKHRYKCCVSLFLELMFCVFGVSLKFPDTAWSQMWTLFILFMCAWCSSRKAE